MLLLVGLALVCGGLLGWASRSLRVGVDPIVERIDRLLPQTQCGQCGYPGCRPYAEAVADGRADINRCPPGGEACIRSLATLLGREAGALDPACAASGTAGVALIVESDCIGCGKCIDACPVDAIVGGPRQMHTVLEPSCTGCGLCLPPCPVDCIELIASDQGPLDFVVPPPVRGATRG